MLLVARAELADASAAGRAVVGGGAGIGVGQPLIGEATGGAAV